MRITELEEIAAEKNLVVLKIPKIFEIRWAQFSFSLLRNILFSWEALIHFFERNQQSAISIGFLQYLKKSHNLKMIAFLADVLFIFQRFQKQLQSELLTIVSMVGLVGRMKKSLTELETTPLLGGFEENLSKKIVIKDGNIYLKSIKLLETDKSRQKLAEFSNLRKNILQAIHTFLGDRFAANEEFLETIKPFITFSENADVRAVHRTVAPDVLLPNLTLQFQDICNAPELQDYRKLNLNGIIRNLSKTAESRMHYKELITVLPRIDACTPHSADAERCISANNRLKTKLRSSLKLETENKYLFIHYNMPELQQWNPIRAANFFLAEKERRSRDVTTSREGKPRRQPYFAGIFPEARTLNDLDPDGAKNGDENGISNKLFDF